MNQIPITELGLGLKQDNFCLEVPTWIEMISADYHHKLSVHTLVLGWLTFCVKAVQLFMHTIYTIKVLFSKTKTNFYL